MEPNRTMFDMCILWVSFFLAVEPCLGTYFYRKTEELLKSRCLQVLGALLSAFHRTLSKQTFCLVLKTKH
jgi:hypothetical protein